VHADVQDWLTKSSALEKSADNLNEHDSGILASLQWIKDRKSRGSGHKPDVVKRIAEVNQWILVWESNRKKFRSAVDTHLKKGEQLFHEELTILTEIYNGFKPLPV
jgi:hypothetical protein